MTFLAHGGALWLLAPVALGFNLPLGRLRAGAGRLSHRRFGLLAASAMLLLALRHVFALAWPEALSLFATAAAGQWLGRRLGAGTPSALRWRAAAYAALLAALLMFLGAPVQAANNPWDRIDAHEPAPVFSLTDQDGRRVSLTDFRGKALVMIFMYTECKDICPTMPQILARMDKWMTAEERVQTHFLGVSIDPNRDTPERLRAFIQNHGLDPQRWTLLTGTVQEATQAAADYGIVVRPDQAGDLVHNAVYIVIDPQGNLRSEFHGLFTPTDEIVKVVRELLVEKTTPAARETTWDKAVALVRGLFAK
ncbi:SCO family protein [Sulfurivermis fontis]|uniref:SCO family protein n=1 Tax=Sulfurivermis fontis TaxID=1972068 RepID=UPI001558F46A|nr:SCO family protein [Sulfurivermis fontis]